MARINKWEGIILPILERYPAARSDDRVLYYWVLKDQGFDLSVSLSRFLLGCEYPSYDSVSRVRRKLQEKYPELLPKENERLARQKAEEDFKEYART